MKFARFSFLSVVILILSSAVPAFAYDGIVTKKTFTMASYTTVGGQTIPNVKVGWESYGTLNAAKDNVILIPHSFSYTSHAAGKYTKDDPSPGYWDAIIGSGKAINTDKYYVISSDTLINLHAISDPNAPNPPGANNKVITTGPASTNPGTGQPYGMDFPFITVRDMVNVQKALLDSLGIKSLHAVAGLSLGAMQTVEWSYAYPDMVKRAIPVSGHGQSDAYLVGILDLAIRFIKLDPKWKGGKYSLDEQPIDGIKGARNVIAMTALHWKWAEQYGRAWADGSKGVLRKNFDDLYKIEAEIDKGAEAFAKTVDANTFLYRIKATQDYIVGHNGSLEEGLARIKAPVLFIYTPDDLMIPDGKV
uniref:Homoserine O-acetyltransferase n=1 Tax=Candidatus Kentrum sp. UNK TaxID=2126344 RepID=A0A451AZJ7_9GAMM|nr:MAG: homoserine O-acetyltransferase [Candidatus Kentron sp. UNK]VFK71479.1 MAG: homoserine O-acetyltransferase [Candidatus Kentron sp. UNK]